jgi:hypothetical protein
LAFAPRPPERALFKPARMPVFDASPAVLEEVRAWDLASSLAAGQTAS